jgi:hypothetical protein
MEGEREMNDTSDVLTKESFEKAFEAIKNCEPKNDYCFVLPPGRYVTVCEYAKKHNCTGVEAFYATNAGFTKEDS